MSSANRRPELYETTALEEAQAIIEALRTNQVDAVVGEKGVALLRLREMEERLEAAFAELETRIQHRTAEANNRARQLQALALELTETEERERRRLAVTLHDGLQQQLVGIRFRLDLLRRKLTDPGCEKVVDQLLELTDESIQSSRSLSMELSPPMLYHEGLPAALEWLAESTEERCGLHVTVETDPDANPEDERLRVFLFQAAREMLFNVVKHAGDNRARLTLVRLNGEYKLSVADHGDGFDPTTMDDENSEPTGFGLVSIRERAELLGARLEVTSSPGDGAEVSLLWPLEAAMPGGQVGLGPQPTTSEAHAAGPRPVREAHSPLRVLLADDHATVRHGLRTLLEDEEDLLVVGGVSTGQEALEAVDTLRPDVVVMDIAMPVLDGIEATRRLRARHPHIRVIGLSMFDNGDASQRMLDAGAEVYLPKAGPSHQLIAAIRGDQD